MHLANYLFNLLKKARSDLAEIKDEVKAANLTYQAKAKEDKAQPPVLRAEIRTPQAVIDKEEAYAKRAETRHIKREHRDSVRLIVEGTGIALAIVLVVVAFWQWREMVRATDAATRAAQVAEETFKDARQSFKIDQRPYVIVNPPVFTKTPKAGGNMPLGVTVRNIGKTPAADVVTRFQNLTLRARVSWGSERKTLTDIQDRTFAYLVERFDKPLAYDSPSKQDIAPNHPVTYIYTGNQIFPKKQLDEIMRGEVNIYFVGIIRYSDAYEQPYETRFCYFFAASADKQRWLTCEANNSIK